MLLVKVMNGSIKMSTCPSGLESDTDDDINHPLNQFSRNLVRGKYACKLQDLLYQQSLQNSDFCDVTLHIDNSVMKAHWCVLVMCPYFQSLYDSGMKESVSGVLNLNFGAAYAMKDAIKFLYTGEVHVSMERARDLLEVADYLQISEMTEVCVRYLKGITLSLENCVQILLLSSLHNLETYDSAFKFVCGHFPELMAGTDLLNFTKSSLLSLVSDVTLSYVRREDFFDFIVRWTEQDKEHRKKDFEELFCALDFYSVPPATFANKIEKHPLVMESEKCQQMVCLESKLKGMMGTAPCARHMHDVIVMGGGVHKDQRYRFMFYPRNINSSLYAYFVRENRWAKMPDLPYGISKPLMAITEDGQLLVIDSVVQDDSEKQKQLLCYCSRENTWTSSKMNYPEGDFDFNVHAFLACGSRLFLVASSKQRLPVPITPPSRGRNGGAANNPPPQTVLYHVQLLELHRETGDLSVRCGFFQRCSNSEIHAVCQETHNSPTLNGGFIYVLGSKCVSLKAKNTSKKKSTKFFVYNIQTNRAFEVYGNKVGFEPLAFGLTRGFLASRLGKVNHKLFHQAQRKVLHNNDYTIKLPPTDAGREEFSTISVNDEVYIFGGKLTGTQEPTTSAAKFSFETQMWTELDPLPTPLIGAGITRGKMAVDVLRCHLECPHCSYFPLKERTTYSVTYSTRDRDDVGSGRFYIDDSDGSDDSDYYDYDGYDPSYSDDGWGPYLDPDEYDLYDLF